MEKINITKKSPIVVLETPFKGRKTKIDFPHILRNLLYAYACARDCLKRGENYTASHILHGLATDDNSEERYVGMGLGDIKADRMGCEKNVSYLDEGCSNGMQSGTAKSKRRGREIETRRLGYDWRKKYVRELASYFPKGWYARTIKFLDELRDDIGHA